MKDSREVLKPCPFCESAESSWKEHPVDCYLNMILVQIRTECDAYTKEMCEEAWNTRPTEEALKEKIAELQKEKAEILGVFKKFKRGSCFCEVGIGNPNYRGEHSFACREAKTILEKYEGD